MFSSTMAAAVAASVAAVTASAGPLTGVTVNLDPGHNPGNAAHAAQIDRIVHEGPIRKACDTVGTSTNAGYPESTFTLQLATRVARRLRADFARGVHR